MTNFTLSLLLGLAAAVANIVGGLVVVQRHWERRFLKYFIALGSGFMLAAALLEMVPESIELAGDRALALVLGGYLLVHFFEHAITAHFHFGEETHPEELIRPSVGYTAVLGMLIHKFFFRWRRHRFRVHCFELSGHGDFSGRLSAQDS